MHAQSQNLQHRSEYNENKVGGVKENPGKNPCTVFTESFALYMNRVMETNWSEQSVAVLRFSVVFLWRRGEPITSQLNEISGLFLSCDSIEKRQMKLAHRCLFKAPLFSLGSNQIQIPL